MSHSHDVQGLLDERLQRAVRNRKALDLPAFRVPLIHLRFLLPIAMEPVPDERHHFCPEQLRYLGICRRDILASVAPHRDQADSKGVGVVEARP